MSIVHSDLIEVRVTPEKGRGVFARRLIPAATQFERVPVLVFDDDILNTQLYDYLFEWDEDTVGLAMGYGSIYNHSFYPNARYDDEEPMIKVFSALRDIEADEEITINYNGSPERWDPVDFEVID
jgi:SET domain-containing protein